LLSLLGDSRLGLLGKFLSLPHVPLNCCAVKFDRAIFFDCHVFVVN
jgi:hypothetical protein